jgi:hypothetical protein
MATIVTGYPKPSLPVISSINIVVISRREGILHQETEMTNEPLIIGRYYAQKMGKGSRRQAEEGSNHHPKRSSAIISVVISSINIVVAQLTRRHPPSGNRNDQ